MTVPDDIQYVNFLDHEVESSFRAYYRRMYMKTAEGLRENERKKMRDKFIHDMEMKAKITFDAITGTTSFPRNGLRANDPLLASDALPALVLRNLDCIEEITFEI